MEPDTQIEAPIFETHFDKTTPENIINLDKVLRGLRAEVDIKLHNFYAYEGENRELYINRLTALAEELDTAINEIDSLVNMVSTQGDEFKQAFYQSELMQKFDGIVTKELVEMTKLKKQF